MPQNLSTTAHKPKAKAQPKRPTQTIIFTSALTARAQQPARKPELIRLLLSAPGGATMAALVAATSWQPHSIRAAMTGLRKQGHAIQRETIDGATRYMILAAAEPAQ